MTSPQPLPVYKMQPGEVMRLRILNGTDGIFLRSRCRDSRST